MGESWKKGMGAYREMGGWGWGGGVKLGKYVRISTAYFPFLKIKKKNENDSGNGDFIDVTSE